MNTGIATTTDITITIFPGSRNPSTTVTGMNIGRPLTHTNTGLTSNTDMNTTRIDDCGLRIADWGLGKLKA
jgi:hypothetical protein